MKPMHMIRYGLRLALSFSVIAPLHAQSVEMVEEVARLEIVGHVRSPVDNRLLTPGEYEALKVELTKPSPARVSTKLQELILVLKLRKVLKTFVPFVP